MTAHPPVTSICTPALENVLGQHCLPWLGPQQLVLLRAASRAMRDLVDGPSHEAWQGAAAGFLRPSVHSLPRTIGLEWQAAIRQEWLSQRALHTASLQHVHKVKACSPHHTIFWVAAASPNSHCYLLSRPVEGPVTLLNPSEKTAQPKQLALEPSADCHHFVPADGHLHVVELVSSKPQQHLKADPLRWHTIDAATGRTLASEQKHYWPEDHFGSAIYHASGRVLGLVDNSTLAIMHAETLHELARCNISPRHTALLENQAGRLDGVAWSSSGAMLAIAIWISQRIRERGVDDGVAEVHIFDTASAKCLQSISMDLPVHDLEWSPGSDQLAAYFFKDLKMPGRGSDQWKGKLRLIQPSSLEMTKVKHPMIEQRTAQCRGFQWSPCGQLLVALWESHGPFYHSQGCTCVDPITLEQIILVPRCPGSVCWATKPHSSLQHPRLSAFFPGPPYRSGSGAHVNFVSHGDSKWEHAVCERPREHLNQQDTTFCLALNGGVLVGRKRSSTGHMYAFHWSLDPSSAHGYVMPERPISCDHSWLHFAPLPPCWPQIYAYMHWAEAAGEPTKPDSSSSKQPTAISLVETGRITVLGTWSVEHLSCEAEGRLLPADAEQAVKVAWAPNGRHLAVLCDTCTMVMTFGATS